MKKTLKEFSADIYQTLIEKNADGLVIVDAEGSIQFLNPAAISLLKRTETELLGQSFGFPIVSKRHTEFDILRPGGIVTVEMSAAKIEWKGQTSFLVSLRDVSGRNKIYALASRLAAIVDSSQDAILSIDLDGIVLTWNRGAEHLYGYQEKEMVGRSCIVLYSAANREEFALAIASLKMGKPSEPYETVQVTKQGVVIEVAVSFSIIKDATGTVSGGSVIARDITKLKNAEKQIFADAQRLEKITEALPGAVFQCRRDSKGKVTWPFVSGGIRGLYEITSGQLKNHPNLLSQFMVERTKALTPSTEESVQNLMPWKREYEIKTSGGTAKWIFAHSIPEKNKDGSVVWNGVMLDITERKQMERELRRARDYSENLIRTANVLVVVLDLNGIVKVVNEAAEIITGYTIQELTGKNWFDFMLPAGWRSKVIEEFKEIPLGKFPRHFENSVRTKSGKERYMVWQYNELIEDGKVTGIVSFGIDVTEQKKTEYELRRSVERFDLAMQATQDGLWEWDTREKCYYSSRFKELLGCSKAEMTDNVSEFWSRMHPEDVGPTDARMKEHLEKKVPFDVEYRLKHKNGEYLSFQVRAQAEWDPDTGKALRVVGSIRDLTERKRVEDQLRQAQKMEAVGRLTGGIAHDFNNLLTVINGYSEMILLEPALDDKQKLHMEEILKAGLRAKILIAQLLAFSRRQLFSLIVSNLNDVVLDQGKMLRRLIGEDLEISIISGDSLWAVKVDPSQIGQILMNLAVNARDAMFESRGGKLTIKTSNVCIKEQDTSEIASGEYVLLAVSDTGAGMSEEVKIHLFEPFFTTKKTGEGTGLGLAMCFGIVKQSGGWIRTISEPGRGTTFEIYFPRSLEKLPSQGPEKKPENPPGGSETILLVEDDSAVRMLIAAILTRHGYKVLEAENGDMALRVANKKNTESIQLTISDVVMPQMSGPEYVEQIKRVRPEVKVLLVSGYMDDKALQLGIQQLKTNFLQKPFTPAVLLFKVREVLDA